LSPLQFAPLVAEDWSSVRRILAEGIATGAATFETEPPSWGEWDEAHLKQCRLVARHEGEVVGWTALTRYSRRAVYAGVAEISIYVAEARRNRGVGKALLAAAVAATEEAGFWTLLAGVFPENAASRAVHEACGFREVGVRERLGKLRGVWRDVLLFERRSAVRGVD
jgi:phosphinothricin acetyltransferase